MAIIARLVVTLAALALGYEIATSEMAVVPKVAVLAILAFVAVYAWLLDDDDFRGEGGIGVG